MLIICLHYIRFTIAMDYGLRTMMMAIALENMVWHLLLIENVPYHFDTFTTNITLLSFLLAFFSVFFPDARIFHHRFHSNGFFPHHFSDKRAFNNSTSNTKGKQNCLRKKPFFSCVLRPALLFSPSFSSPNAGTFIREQEQGQKHWTYFILQITCTQSQ